MLMAAQGTLEPLNSDFLTTALEKLMAMAPDNFKV